jgi:hypothetical protein
LLICLYAMNAAIDVLLKKVHYVVDFATSRMSVFRISFVLRSQSDIYLLAFYEQMQ